MTDQDREKKIAEIREAVECYFEAWSENTNPFAAHCQFLLSELEREREENRKLREELESHESWKAISEIVHRQFESAQQENEKLIEGLRMATDLLGTVPMNDGRLWGAYNKLCDTLKSVGVEVDASETPNQR